MNKYTQSRTEILKRDRDALIKAMELPGFKASIEMTDEECRNA